MSVSSSSSYSANPSTNLSTIAGGTPGKTLSQDNQGLHAQHKPAPPTGTTTTASTTAGATKGTSSVPSPSIARSASPAVAQPGSTTANSLSAANNRDSNINGDLNTPVFHSDSPIPGNPNNNINSNNINGAADQMYHNKATPLPSTPLILTPELNDSLTNAYVPSRSDNHGWMKDLIAKMDAARIEIDRKAHADQQKINEDASRRVNLLLQEHKHQQDALIASSHQRNNEIDNDFMKKREDAIAAVEAQKLKIKQTLEQDLVTQQQKLANDVRSKVSTIAEDAKSQKLKITEEAQRQERLLGSQAATSFTGATPMNTSNTSNGTDSNLSTTGTSTHGSHPAKSPVTVNTHH